MDSGAPEWWALLFGLGAFHGLNPAMGWLFAVARGLQEGSRRVLWSSMLPLAGGHFLAVGAAIALAIAVGEVVPLDVLKWPVGTGLVALGAFQLARHRHPRYRGFRVGVLGLAAWSFLMATIHGAGVMVVPLFLNPTDLGRATLAAGVHGIGYVVVTALLAGVFYEKIGVGALRKAWVNVDLVWATALVLGGVLTFLL